MAKRRKDTDEEDDKGFKLPKFDEEKFLKRERRNIKVTYLTVFLSIIMAFVCFGFWVLMGPESAFRWPLVILLALVNLVFLRNLFNWRNIDISDFTQKNWFMTILTYIFTWLIIFIVIVNPPVYDDESPKINAMVLPEMQEFGGNVQIIAKITDNSGITKSGITLTLDDAIIDSQDYEFNNNILIYTFDGTDVNNETTHHFSLNAKDSYGREAPPYDGSFTFSNNVISVPSPLNADKAPGAIVGSADTIKFRVNANITRLYYTIDDGTPINVTDKESDYYITYPEYIGWPKNQNVTMKVFAEITGSFGIVSDKTLEQMNEKEYKEFQAKAFANTFNATIYDSQTYYFQVADESGVGKKPSPTAEPSTIEITYIPGFEALVFLISLIAVVLILKYRKKESRK